MVDPEPNPNLKELDFLKESAEEIFSHLCSLGEDAAKKVGRLRDYIIPRMIELEAYMSVEASARYYRQFKGDTIGAITVYLLSKNSPVPKGQILEDLGGSAFFEKKLVRDSIDNQTKPGKNGLRYLLEQDQIISLTSKGVEYAENAVAQYGKPPALNSGR